MYILVRVGITEYFLKICYKPIVTIYPSLYPLMPTVCFCMYLESALPSYIFLPNKKYWRTFRIGDSHLKNE